MPPLYDCPQCGLPTEVVQRWWAQSTSGPVLCVAVQCVLDHHFAGHLVEIVRQEAS